MIELNDKVIEFGEFPNKETSVAIEQSLVAGGGINLIVFQFEDNTDLIKLMFVKRHIETLTSVSCGLVIKYMPYSRLDRVEGDIVFTLKYVADFINWLNFEEVLIVEPHSDVTSALVNNSTSISMTEKLFNEGITSGNIEFDAAEDFVCYPDATAHKRYGKIGDYKALIGMKDRDFVTGWINNLDIFIPKGYSVDGKNVVIVDDLCSKGGTFILTAEELRKLGAKTITLVVAHCERTILEGEILITNLIDKVVTTDSIISIEESASFDKMYVAKLEDMA